MKSLLILLLFVLSVSAQISLDTLLSERRELETKLSELRLNFTEDATQIRDIKRKLTTVDKKIAELEPSQPAGVLTKESQLILGDIIILKTKLNLCGLQQNTATCKENTQKQLFKVYSKVSKKPELIEYLLSESVSSYEVFQKQEKSAPQASQVANEQSAELLRLLVIQNQRIIELLEKLTTKK